MKTKHWILLSTGVTLAGLGIWVAYQVKQLYNYDYKITNLSIKKLSKDKLILGLKLLFTNSSNLSFTIHDFIFNISINGNYVGNVRQSLDQKVKAKSDSVITFDADITLKNVLNFSEITKLLKYYVTDKSKINITIDGKIIVSHNFIKVAVPIEELTYNLTELT